MIQSNVDTDRKFLMAAMAYVSRGWRVFPLQPDNGDGKTLKHPAVKWESETTTDANKVKQWFTSGDYGLAIAAGNGISILDVDVDKGGADSLLESASDEDLETPTVETPTGGLHLYYLTPSDRIVANWVKFQPGLDLRTDGGYVVAPPTTRDGTAYRWLKTVAQTPMRLLPEWVKKEQKEGSRSYQEIEYIVPGEWNSKMTSIAGASVRSSLFHSEDELYAHLQAMSDVRSHPDHRHMTADDTEWLKGLAHRAWEQWRGGRFYDQTEEGQAEYFADLFGDRARFNWTTKQWMVWKGHWWEPDMGGKVRTWIGDAHRDRLAKARRAYQVKVDSLDAATLAVKKDRETALGDENKELSFALAMGSFQSQEHVWGLARKKLGSAKIDWDTKPELAGVLNGVVNLETGELEAGEPKQMISKHMDIEYDPGAKCPRWEKFVSEIFAHDAVMSEYFHRVIGYALTGLTTEDCWFLCYGTGGNGKSTALQKILLSQIFGPYGMYARIDSFTQRQNRSSIPNDIAEMEGKRMVVTSEPGSDAKLDEERLKSMTTGGRQRARNLNEKEREFTPVLKCFMETNYLIDVNDDSKGFWRRVRCLPFTQSFDPQTEPNLEAKLIAERQGILSWVVRGAKKFFSTPDGDDRLATPKRVWEETEEYRRNQDKLANWVEERIDLEDEDVLTTTEDLHKDYRNWMQAQDSKYVLGQRTFGNRLRAKFGNRMARTAEKRGWHLKLKRGTGPDF